MIITEIQADFNLQFNAEPRSLGLHVSEIIRDVAGEMGYLRKDDEEELDWTLARYRATHGADIAKMYPTVFYRVMLGLAFEDWLGPQLPHTNFHGIGELQRDGLVGTPDGLEFTNDAGGSACIHEFKLTWKSSRSDRETPQQRIAREFMYLCQTKSYCAMVRASGVECLRSILHVFWVNGNYRGSGPEYRRYQLDFTPDEVEANWRLMSVMGKRLQKIREAQERTQ